MRPEDVYELTGVADPRISPDGKRVAYHVWSIDRDSNEYRGAIWVAAVDGSEEPRQFTSGEKRDGSPRWSPDSTRLVITARARDEAYEEEDERKRKPRRFRRVFHKLDSVGWTGDRRKHIWIVDLDGNTTQLTDGDFEDDQPTWTPDGKRIAFTALRSENWDVELVARLYVVDANGGEPEELTGDETSYGFPTFAPDGRLAYEATVEDGTFPRHTQVGVAPKLGAAGQLLTTSLDRQCGPYPPIRGPLWNGDRVVFALEDGGNVHLYSAAANGSSEPELLVGGEQVIGGYDVVGDALVYVGSTHTTMRELFNGRDGKQLTHVGDAFTGGCALSEPERFTAVSKDGTEVDSWIVRPPDFDATKKYPVILTIHGGPFTQYGTGFFDEVQVMAGGGYVVLFSNPRGGSGYSEEWGRAIRGPLRNAGPGWGTVDYEDVMGVVDTALEKFDFLDGDRMGVIGGSYGGFMTSWIVGHTNRFKAAISERAVNNLVSMFGSSDLFWIFERQFGGPMWEDVDSYLGDSPSTYAQNIDTPVLVLHSENDLRCAIEQGEHLFTLLRLLGKDVELLRFPAESHELTRSGSPIHRVLRFEAVLEWFDRYLR